MKTILIISLALAVTASSALALNDASFVASTGNDANLCTRTSPCLSFQRAHNQTNFNGIVTALDSADYGTLIITKAITIDGDGVGRIVSNSPAHGIFINAPGGPVAILNLRIEVVNSAFSANGIQAQGNTLIENVIIVGAPFYGVLASVTGNHTIAKNLTVHGASAGFAAYGTSATVRDSVFSGGGYGIYALANSGVAANILIERTEVSFNSDGLHVDGMSGGATVRISDSVITGNNTGFLTANGGQIISFRTNMLAGNTTDGSTPFSVSLK